MRKATVEVTGVSPLSWSRYVDADTLEGETKKDMEGRVWRERFHVNDEGNVVIPPMAIKNGLVDAAKYMGEKIPGKGNKTWTGKIEAGILAFTPIDLGVTRDDLEPLWLPVPGSPGKGKRGTGARVLKCFPQLSKWSGVAEIYIVDDVITAQVFEHYMQTLGRFVGWGRFRIANGGYYGRFDVGNVTVEQCST